MKVVLLLRGEEEIIGKVFLVALFSLHYLDQSQIIVLLCLMHCPILFDAGRIRRALLLFVLKMWLRVEGFKKKLKAWWQGLCFISSFSFVLTAKLKSMKDFFNS